MSMEVNRQELKARARERLRASHPAFWKITLVYLLLTSGVTAVADLAGAARIGLPPLHLDTFALFLSLLVILYTTVMHLGYQWWALRTYRQQPTGYGALIDGFSMAGRVILMNVVIFFSALGWAVTFALPYSLVLFLLSGLVSSGVGMLFFSLLAMGGAFLGSLWIGYRYAMAPYLLIDHPELGASAAVRESVAMMKGWKWEFCKLDLSFLGWHLINALLSLAVTLVFALPMLPTLMEAGTDLAQLLVTPSLALPWTAVLLSSLIQLPLSLWLTPYQTVTFSGFYQARVMQSTQVPPVWERSDPYDVS